MSDYCYQCTEKFIGVAGDKNDLRGISSKKDTDNDRYPLVICEGCGPCQVDHEGKCISKDCEEKHGDSNK